MRGTYIRDFLKHNPFWHCLALTHNEVLDAVVVHVGHGGVPVGLAREVVLPGDVACDGHGLADDLAVDLQDGELVERDAWKGGCWVTHAG